MPKFALTLPSLRDGSLPLPQAGEGNAVHRVTLSRNVGEGWGESESKFCVNDTLAMRVSLQ